MNQVRHVKPYAEIVDPEKGNPQEGFLSQEEKKSTRESGISLIDMPTTHHMSNIKPEKVASDEKVADMKVVTVQADPVPAAAAAKKIDWSVIASRTGLVLLGTQLFDS